jgi:chemotaxis protein methyltransferase CheR
MTARAATLRSARPVATGDHPDGISAAVLNHAAALLTATTGLTFPGGRRTTLRRALGTLTVESDLPDTEILLDALDRDPRLRARLVSLVRIGETSFFRHPEQLDVISRRILPMLADAPSTSERSIIINIWSAGCSTGEEAYTLAILAAETFGPDAARVVRVAATDIDQEALRVAQAGAYGRWAFRTPLAAMAPYFDDDGRARRVRPSVAGLVTFSRDNLTREGAGLPPGLTGPPGLILCRNVTMYLSPDARRQVAARFLRLLAPGGWLVVAPVELSRSVYSGFESMTLDGHTIYRRPLETATGRRIPARADRPAVVERPVPAPPVRAPAAARLGVSAAPPRRRAASPVVRKPIWEGGPIGAADRFAATRTLADQGRLEEAWLLAEHAVRERPYDREGYLLVASIAEARDDLADASAALRRAIYLDRTDAVAVFRLGLLEWRLGHTRRATARLHRAVRLVDGRDDEALLDATSDLTVARLRSTVGMFGHG